MNPGDIRVRSRVVGNVHNVWMDYDPEMGPNCPQMTELHVRFPANE